MRSKLGHLWIGFILLCSCQAQGELKPGGAHDSPVPVRVQTASSTITVQSSAFVEGGMIPQKYTCQGDNVSPPLSWSGIPRGTTYIAIICEDPDAPAGTFTHWLLFNLPARVHSLDENVPPAISLPGGANQGLNDFGKAGYGGPCPPNGTHRYYFKVYAVNVKTSLANGSNRPALLKALDGHVLAQGALMGKYRKG